MGFNVAEYRVQSTGVVLGATLQVTAKKGAATSDPDLRPKK